MSERSEFFAELERALKEAGWTEDDVQKFLDEELQKLLLSYLRGKASLVVEALSHDRGGEDD